MAIVPVPLANIGAMASVAGFKKPDIRVGGDFCPRSRQKANERIIFCAQNERGYPDPVNHVRGRCSCVVVGCAIESAIKRSHSIIEISQALDTAQPRQVIAAGERALLGTHASLQLEDEILLVNAIGRQVECVGGSCEFYCRSNCAHRDKLFRPVLPPLACRFQHQISAHRVTAENKFLDSIVSNEVFGNRHHVP